MRIKFYKVCEKRLIINTIMRMQKNWIEHVFRENNLLKELIED